MAIKVNGKLVAGLGKSAYEQAQEGGYIGTEEEFISALANIGSNPTAEGLPVNDVRTGIVRDGQSITAGDVVNVQDGEIYHDVVAQKNVENRLNTVVMTGSDLFKLNESYSILIGNSSSNPAAYLIDNTTGKSIYGVSAYSSAVSSVSGDRLDDTHFVVTFESSGISRWSVYQVTGTTITLADGTRSLGDNSTNPVVVTLSTSNFAVTHNSNGRLRLTVGSYPFASTANELNSVNPAHISATRIPDDDSGNKRVCICFSDTGDGNKGKAVIATIDSANAVTFGDVVTIAGAEANAIVKCCYSNGVIYYLDGQHVCVLNESLNTLTSEKIFTGSLIGRNEIIPLLNGAVAIETSARSDGGAVFVCWNGSAIAKGAPYKFYKITAEHISATAITNKLLIAYADGSNSNYGTTTILEIFGNRIAGSFLNNSKDAIALESGEGGDTIKLGFGGYCTCEGMTAGQTIDSEGVTAYSPLDGWLKIIPWQEQAEPEIAPYVIGEYTGNGASPTVIDVGFMPSVFIIGAILTESNYTTQIDYQYCVLFRGDDYFIANISRKNFSNATWKATGIEMTDSGSGAKDRFNESGVTYRYIAFR